MPTSKQFKHERDLQAHVIAQLRVLKKQGWELHWFKAHEKLQSGISDLIICCNGWFVAVELKVGKNKPTMLQTLFLGDIESAGGYSKVVHCWESLYALLCDIRRNAD